MDGDFIIGVLMILFWFFSSLIARFARRRQQPEIEELELERDVPQVPQGPPRRAATVEKALRDLAGQLGVEVEPAPGEQPVAAEHTVTASEHRRTLLETGSTLSEHAVTPSEHRRTVSEARRTASESIFEPPEHSLTASEHQRGDARAVSAPPGRRARPPGGSDFARSIRADLAGGRGPLARAILLREILGPPVGLRSPRQEQS